ncbi:MAG TPA: branched-chain amino acid ABC transporter permease [Candidatus Limnocylindria bacterium]|nr:branched-chain amino acid ABC transporter permease [Candidatus Limnocylindria bacterium]
MLVEQLVNGVMLGAVYALIAIGYTLIFGVLGLLHLAHGEVFMVGAFAGLVAVRATGSILIAIAFAMLVTGVLGIAIERVAFRPLRGAHHLAPLATTIGTGIVLQETTRGYFGAEQQGFPPTFATEVWQLGPVRISSVQVFMLLAAVVLMGALQLFLARTRAGRAIRATAEDPSVATLLGVNVTGVVLLCFFIGSALAGAAGVLVGIAYNSVHPFIGVQMGIKGLVVMMLGGLGNVPGAMLGGLLLGVLEVLGAGYLASSYRDAFAFGALMLVLLARPEGLLGLRAPRRD